MKRVLSVICSLMVMCFCMSGFAKEISVGDLVNDLFDILPWNVETGEYKDGREIKVEGEEKKPEDVNGENEEKGRMEEEMKKKEKEAKISDKPEVKSIDLIVILDKSGSMYSMTDDTIGGFNSLLEEQRKKDIPVKVSVGMFNQILEAKLDRVDLKDVKDLTRDDYIAQGTTALLDAVGNTLSAIKGREEVNVPENKVLVVIITDGKENASKEWKKPDVKKLIEELQEKGYEFVFLGADIDAVSVAGGIGISQERSMKFKKTGAGVQANFKAMSVMMDSMSAGNNLVEDAKWKNSIVEDKN